MIKLLWLRIFVSLFLVSAPVLVLEHLQRRESLSFMTGLQASDETLVLLESHMKLLRSEARETPEETTILRGEFEKTSAALRLEKDKRALSANMAEELGRNALRNTLLLLVVCLAVSFLVASRIVKLFKRLLEKSVRDSLKLEQLHVLDNWQRVAKSLVHELRAPLSPIKLAATGLVPKRATLKPEVYDDYLGQSSSLIVEQVTLIEEMIESFTSFARLPSPERKPMDLLAFTEKFVETYHGFSPRLTLKLEHPLRAADERDAYEVLADASLLQRLIFNLVRNAVEANEERDIKVTLRVRTSGSQTSLLIANNGISIPEKLAERLFEPRFERRASHGDSQRSGQNLGLGLAICRKIALDHEGDLVLRDNTNGRVSFELTLSSAKRETRSLARGVF